MTSTGVHTDSGVVFVTPLANDPTHTGWTLQLDSLTSDVLWRVTADLSQTADIIADLAGPGTTIELVHRIGGTTVFIVDINGTTTVGDTTTTTLTTSGNGTIGGNLGVTGTSTLTGLLTANGGVTGTTGTFSGLLTANGGLTGTTGTFSGAVTSNGSFTTNSTAAFNNANTFGGSSTTTFLSGSTITFDAGSTLNLNGTTNLGGNLAVPVLVERDPNVLGGTRTVSDPGATNAADLYFEFVHEVFDIATAGTTLVIVDSLLPRSVYAVELTYAAGRNVEVVPTNFGVGWEYFLVATDGSGNVSTIGSLTNNVLPIGAAFIALQPTLTLTGVGTNQFNVIAGNNVDETRYTVQAKITRVTTQL